MENAVIVKGETITFHCPHCESKLQLRKDENSKLFLSVMEEGKPIEIARADVKDDGDDSLSWVFGKKDENVKGE